MNVRVFLLKKFPTNKYLDCPVPKDYYDIMEEYAEAYHKNKVKELNLVCVSNNEVVVCNWWLHDTQVGTDGYCHRCKSTEYQKKIDF
jgi:hypothetical protein